MERVLQCRPITKVFTAAAISIQLLEAPNTLRRLNLAAPNRVSPYRVLPWQVDETGSNR